MMTIKEIAEELNVSRTVIYRRMEYLSLDDPRYLKATRGKIRILSDNDISIISNVERLKGGRGKKRKKVNKLL